MANDDLLCEGREAFSRCRDAMRDNHLVGLQDLRFSRLDDQWPDAIRKMRETEQRPCLTINKMPAFIRQVVNDARQNKPQISVHPVDSGADKETADVLAGIIRNIETVSNADVAYDTGVEEAVTSGFGYWRISLSRAFEDALDDELEIKIDRLINQFAVYGDPNSTEADSSDWDVCFVTDVISKEQFKRKYKGKADVSFDSDGWRKAGDEWLSEKGVVIAEWWKREEVDREIAILSDGRRFSVEELQSNADLQVALESGLIEVVRTGKVKAKKVTQTIMSGVDVLQEEKVFPGSYIPIIPVYGDEIIVEGKRYFRSLINGAKDAQMMFNFWRTASTEMVALAPKVPYIGPVGAFDDDERWNTANTKSHAYLEYKGLVPPQRQPMDFGVAAGALQEALNASDDMKAIVGLYDASLGARSNETSGRAIMARQREGDVSTFHFIDNLSRAIRHTGKVLIGVIPHVYSGERIMRLIGEDGKPENKPVNQPYPKTDENGQPMQEEVQDETGAKVMRAVMAMHDLSVGKYDVTVSSGPSFTSRREEAAMSMTELVRSFPQAAPAIAPELAKNLDWPGAERIAEKFEAMFPSPGKDELPPQVKQMMEQGQQMIQDLQKQLEEAKSDQGIKTAELQIQQQQLQLDAYKAQTDRMKVENEARDDQAKNQIEMAKATVGQMQPQQQPLPI
jgi:hypothetical protein